jgi:hypothetical protein
VGREAATVPVRLRRMGGTRPLTAWVRVAPSTAWSPSNAGFGFVPERHPSPDRRYSHGA